MSQPSTAPETAIGTPTRLPRIVWLLGLVSLCNDAASEMVVPLVPLLLASFGVAPAVWVGVIEGSADALASVLKRWAGTRADRSAHTRDRLALTGYVVSNAVRPLLALAGSGVAVLGVRLLDRVGKGLRSAPRDALIAASVADSQRGAAFGLHRAFDNTGAVVGALAAAGLLVLHRQDLQAVVWWSLLPGVAAVLWLLVALRQAHRDAQGTPVASMPVAQGAEAGPDTPAAMPRSTPDLTAELGQRRRAGAVLRVVAAYTLLRLPEALLLLRGHELGLTASTVLLLWAAYSAAKAMTGHLGGRFGDRLGHARWLVRAWLGMAAALALLAWAGTPSALWLAALLFGLVYGAAEGGERALVAEVSAQTSLGRTFGNYHLATGLAAIPGGVLLGLVWTRFGAPAAFGLSALGLALCALWLQRMPDAVPQPGSTSRQSV